LEKDNVRNALGSVQSLLVLGGASDIGAAIAERLVSTGCSSVVLAGRRPEAMAPVAERLRQAGGASGDEVSVSLTTWDALDVPSHADAVKASWDATDGDDLDCVVFAAGVLGDQSDFEANPDAAAEAISANYTGAVTTLLHVANCMREQGHGTIVVLSSVAGERARKSNYVYGSTKAGLDAFSQGLGDALVDSGVRVIVVRPGFVRTSMTEGKDPAPLATTPDKVAEAVTKALAGRQETVWVPTTFRFLMSAFRHMPRAVWRKVSADR
jgi:decaprenylphospho-beta-D-erythro-pentofuranosid-2-ulose 2-reductase